VRYDGAVANIVFGESAAAEYPQERLTVLAKGKVATLDDFSKLTLHDRRSGASGRVPRWGTRSSSPVRHGGSR
jgi:hypothetical protein